MSQLSKNLVTLSELVFYVWTGGDPEQWSPRSTYQCFQIDQIGNLKTLIVRLFDVEAQRDDDPECKRVQLLRVQSPLSEFT